jgi:6-phosphogluconolactonase
MSLITRHRNGIAAAEACGSYIIRLLEKATAAHGRATLAISGGSSPRPMFEMFARSGFAWDLVHIYWVDERCVPADDPQSNFKLANAVWLEPAHVPAPNVHRVLTELEPKEAARRYAEELRQVPHFDVIHRGMGPDAHTASLFPGDPLIGDKEGLAAAVYIEKLKQWRVTMLPAVLNAALHTVILAAGADKAAALDAVLTGPNDPSKYPAQIAARNSSKATWFVDEAAAAQLPAGPE